jgi:hypothetical protein
VRLRERAHHEVLDEVGHLRRREGLVAVTHAEDEGRRHPFRAGVGEDRDAVDLDAVHRAMLSVAGSGTGNHAGPVTTEADVPISGGTDLR